MIFSTLLFLAQIAVSALAAPIVNERDGITAASASVISSYTPYIQLARAAYCTEGASVWTCGAACNAISNFQIYAGGGDGAATPSWFVGWSSSLNSIVVAHEGTDPTQFLSLLNDADFVPDPMDQAYFPGIIHGGFQDTFKRSASSILTAVKTVMAAKSSSKVTLVGHSLGGALALLDSVYLKIQIPSITIKTVTLGGPRVGNPAFADYLKSFDLTRITHELDPIPIVPGRGLGFAHPQGEVHQSSADDKWYNCPGDIVDHLGPYNDLWVGTIYC
ncbi:hypothetical protein FRC04_005580 [Tulasnella sp. 424]|nr:hypothetical protein FRC04_005580 [Tulasnella sp. 424]